MDRGVKKNWVEVKGIKLNKNEDEKNINMNIECLQNLQKQIKELNPYKKDQFYKEMSNVWVPNPKYSVLGSIVDPAGGTIKTIDNKIIKFIEFNGYNDFQVENFKNLNNFEIYILAHETAHSNKYSKDSNLYNNELVKPDQEKEDLLINKEWLQVSVPDYKDVNHWQKIKFELNKLFKEKNKDGESNYKFRLSDIKGEGRSDITGLYFSNDNIINCIKSVETLINQRKENVIRSYNVTNNADIKHNDVEFLEATKSKVCQEDVIEKREDLSELGIKAEIEKSKSIPILKVNLDCLEKMRKDKNNIEKIENCRFKR